jgi:hypothetical protein
MFHPGYPPDAARQDRAALAYLPSRNGPTSARKFKKAAPFHVKTTTGKIPATKVPVEFTTKNKSWEGWQFHHFRKNRANPGVQPIRQLTDQRLPSWGAANSITFFASKSFWLWRLIPSVMPR